ncbi:MAG TPA: PEGA domain-containing protein [Candidatus Acidoferrales bacterium]|nr:PEGA domain-containing protein [Candidatus Acidoferrales bacterium]
MAIEYLLVTYPEQRAVLADGNRVGFTNHTFMLPTDEYLITLEGGGYTPPSQDVPLAGTSLVKPMVISFSPTSAAGGVAPVPAAAAPAPAARPAGKKKKNA